MNMEDGSTAVLTLEHILEAKEQRAKVQEGLRTAYRATVVSMTLNIPGPVKYRPEWLGMLNEAAAQLRAACFARGIPLHEERMLHLQAGGTLLMAVGGPGERIKSLTVALEETLAWGRILDLDVFGPAGEQISRETLNLPPRKCLVCDDMAAICVRSMRHGRDEVIQAAMKLIKVYLERQDPEKVPCQATQATLDGRTTSRKIGQLALEAMLMEVAATPAPGLVDRFNSGAHNDMDFSTFIRSSSALSEAMTDFAEAGARHSGPLNTLLPELRRIGIRAEQDMYRATRGVNTQKGLLFLLGVLTAAAGWVLRPSAKTSFEKGISPAEQVAQAAAQICEGLVMRELEVLHLHKPDRQLTAGEHYFLACGLTGVRGEIEAGLPTVFASGLPVLKEALSQGASDNDALVHALIGLMTHTEDTTILHRHDLLTLKQVQTDAGEVMKLGGYLTPLGRKKVEELDVHYIERHLSPGGSADLLAVTWFLHRLEETVTEAKV